MYRNHEAVREAQRQRRLWYFRKFGAIALVVGSIALSVSYGEGTHLLIAVPIGLAAWFGR